MNWAGCVLARPPLEAQPSTPGAPASEPAKDDPNKAILDALERDQDVASAAGKK